MFNIIHVSSGSSIRDAAPARVAVWSRRLLIAALVAVLWVGSMLALEMAGPHARAMLAGEGILINPEE